MLPQVVYLKLIIASFEYYRLLHNHSLDFVQKTLHTNLQTTYFISIKYRENFLIANTRH